MKKNILLFFSLILIFSITFVSCGGGKTKGDRDKSGANSDSVNSKFGKDAVLKQLSANIKDHPNDPEHYYMRAHILKQHGDWKDAADDLDAALDLDSTNIKYWFELADLHLSNGSTDMAQQDYARILRLHPGEPLALNRLAKIYHYNKEYQNSLNTLQQIIDVDKNNWEAFFLEGLNYKEMGDTAKAISSFQTALQLEPKFYDAYIYLGLMNVERKPNLSLQYYNQAIKVDSTQKDAYYNKAMLYQGQKKYNEAKTVYRQLLHVDPQFDDVYFNIGWILIQQDSIKKAKKYFNYALAVEPTYAKAYYYRAFCLEKSDSIDAAKVNYQACIDLTKDKDMEARAQKALDELNGKQ